MSLAAVTPASVRAWNRRGGADGSLVDSGLFQACTAWLLAAMVLVNEANLRVAQVQDYRIDGMVLTRLAVCVVCGLFGLAALHRVGPLVGRMPGLYLCGYAAWALVTAPLAYSPIQSAAGALALCCAILFAAVVTSAKSEGELLRPALVGLTLYIVGSWIAFLAFPEFGRDPYDEAAMGGSLRFGGLSHPNNTGRLCALTLGLTLVAMRHRHLGSLVGAGLVALAGGSLLATGSRTSLWAGLAASALIVWRSLRPDQRTLAALGLAIVVCLGLVAAGLDLTGTTLDSLLATSARSGDPNEVLSLSGRTDLWQDAWSRFLETPLIGHGHGCARFVLAGRDWETHHAHNQFLNILLTTGVVGALCVGAAVAWMLAAALVRPHDLADVVVVLVLVVGFSDVSILQSLPDGYTLVFLIAVLMRSAPNASATEALQA